MITHPTVDLASYALGTLPLPETLLVERHLAGCPVCNAEVDSLRDVVDLLAFVPEPEMVPAAPRAALFARIEQARPEPVTKPMRRRFPMEIAAAFLGAVLVGGGIAGIFQYRTASETQNVIREASNLMTLDATQARVATLAATGGASAKLIYDPAQRDAVLLLTQLPALADGEIYQVWFARGSQRTSAGTFTPGNDGSATIIVRSADPIRTFDGIEVTREPAGGNQRPSDRRVASGGF